MPCGTSLKLDSYGNLYFAAKSKKAIMKVSHSELDKMFALPPRANSPVMRINLTCTEVYSSNTTSYVSNIGAITIEREYLYWTNTDQQSDSFNQSSVCKAFTTPFIKQVPFQTFQVLSDTGASQLVANSAFLFFTDTGNNTYAMNKHGYTLTYYNLITTLNSSATSLFALGDNTLILGSPTGVFYVDVSMLNIEEGMPTPSLRTATLLQGKLPNGQPVNSIYVISEGYSEVITAFVGNSANRVLAAAAAIVILTLSFV